MHESLQSSLLLAFAATFLFCCAAKEARPATGDESATKIYVDASSGADVNPGTSSRPLQTIRRAAQIAMVNYRNGASTTIVINPGTYRESIELEGTGAGSTASIAFEAARSGTVIITGSDLSAGWEPDPSNPTRYTHAWPSRSGPCDIPANFPAMPEIVRRQEMVFVNGVLLNQVLSLRQLAEGSFFVDDGNGRVFVWAPAGTKISSAEVQIAIRPQLFVARRMSQLVLRGLVFEHASTCVSMKPHTAVAIVGGSNHLVEDCRFEWNNWFGFVYNGVSHSAARRIIANHNGASGIAGGQLKDVTYENVETSYNNWRGALGQFYGWDIAGAKFLEIHGGLFKNFKAVGNQTRGLWFDSDNVNVTVDAAFLSHNLTGGLFLEANPGPIVVKNSGICDNGAEGIVTNNSEATTLENNILYNNKGAQIFVNGRAKSRTARNWETNSEYVTVAHKWTLRGNVIVAGDASQLLFENYENNAESSRLFFSTLVSDNNTWYSSQTSKVFQLDSGGPGHQARNVALKDWQSATGQDRNSAFVPPSDNVKKSCELSQ